MMPRSEFYWQAANTVNFRNEADTSRPLLCPPDRTRDGRVTLILRDTEHPSNSIQRHLTGWQASRFANLILAGANGLVTTDPGHRLSVSVYRQGITLWFLDGYERYISLTYSEACVLADWLIRMANKQYMEVA